MFFALVEFHPFVADHLGDLLGSVLRELFLVDRIHLLEVLTVWRQHLPLLGNPVKFLKKALSLLPPERRLKLIVFLVLLRQDLPLLGDALAELQPVGFGIFAALLPRALQVEAHEGVHGGLRGSEVGGLHLNGLLEVGFVALEAVLVSHEKVN